MTQQQRDEQVRHNKKVEEYQLAQQNIAAERAKYERENRPTVEDKNILSVMSRLNADPDYRAMLKKRDNFSPGDPEFEAIQDVLDSMRDAAFADLKLKAPTKRDRLQPVDKPAEPGFLKRFRMSEEDKQALEWANANPKDPRSAQIKQKLGL
jgi:hypothetical protein